MTAAHRTLTAAVLTAFASAAPTAAPAAAPVAGTYSSLGASQQSGDVNGYEIVVIPQAGGPRIVFQCAQGAPSAPVLLPIQQEAGGFSFALQDSDNACSGTYRATLTATGLVLRRVDAPAEAAQVLPRRRSFWAGQVPAPTPYQATMLPFLHQLHAACAGKRLDQLAPAELNGQIEQFEATLSPALDSEIQAQAEVRCAHSFAGTSCGNVAFLEVAQRRALLPRFVQAVCESRLTCSAAGDCTSN